ncbi:MAG: hypothetical protein KA419_16555 [Acidobacteria bacterium]|nr:hypothetical protein [Acidobacteriota bacterium]
MIPAATVILVIWLAGWALAGPVTPGRSLARLPVTEVTVFKDGHAFVLHHGRMPTDDRGSVVLDYLPTPVVGTFWPYAADPGARLRTVTAGRRRVHTDRTALSLRDLVEANVGRDVVVTETHGPEPRTYRARIEGLPFRSGEELEALSPGGGGEKAVEKGNVVLLRTETGVKVIGLERILDLSFPSDYRTSVAGEEFRDLLTLDLEWRGGRPAAEAEVGLVYLQKGIRWVPSYKVELDGRGNAVVRLQATLVNELADLEGVTAHLVVGVPSFEFKDTPDPISLQQAAAQLSAHFRPEARTAYAFSNAIMTQQASAVVPNGAGPGETDGGEGGLGPEVAGSGRAGDLYVFTVPRLTLAKGERTVVTLGEFTMKYRDVFLLDIPFAPPPEVWRQVDGARQAELARLVAAPRVMHKVRLTNGSDVPLTTAPALILENGRVLAQSLMTYAAPGSDADLPVTVAVDVRVTKTDVETARKPDAERWQGDAYARVDLAGKIVLVSHRKAPVEVEVVRHALGRVDTADLGGKVERVNTLEDPGFTGGSNPYPGWWGWFSWPWWWTRLNEVGRIRWTVTLPPGAPVELGYSWHYFWR